MTFCWFGYGIKDEREYKKLSHAKKVSCTKKKQIQEKKTKT
jgi:hypothetical protein